MSGPYRGYVDLAMGGSGDGPLGLNLVKAIRNVKQNWYSVNLNKDGPHTQYGWIEHNLTGQWSVITIGDNYYLYFENESDFVQFKMRWL